MDIARETIDSRSLLKHVFERKWRLEVIELLTVRPHRLSELRRAMPTCSKKMLIDTLVHLERLGWITRYEYSTKLKKVEYSIATDWDERLKEMLKCANRFAPEKMGDAVR